MELNGYSQFVDIDDFSLTKGGPVYRLMLRMGLIEPDSPHGGKKVIVALLLTWLPLFVLSAVQGLAAGNSVKIPFLRDFAVYARFLIAIPLLIASEAVIDRRLLTIVKGFVDAKIVKETEIPAFTSAIDEVSRLRDSVLAEIIIIGVIYVNAFVNIGLELPKVVSEWRITASGGVPSLAGWWYVLVSIPVFQFIIFRWVWRLLIWYRFLQRISKLNLQLVPTHPDGAGGLAFLAIGQIIFAMIVFPLSVVLTGIFANEIVYEEAAVTAFRVPVAVFLILVLAAFIGPLFLFTPILVKVRRNGLLEYGALACEYTQSFDQKWVRKNIPNDGHILGSSDIQSLADLANSFRIIQTMRIVPLNLGTVAAFAVAALIPVILLAVFSIPVNELAEITGKILSRLLR